tara:strand:- start:893 stop:1558 length:666 start_codon:yes stop_codon:yes gene_type:complete
VKEYIKNKEVSYCSKKIWQQKYQHKFFLKFDNYNSSLRDKFFCETIKLINNNFNKFFFLSFGSLLGLIREDDFIEWDDNIDLSFFLEKNTYKDLKNLQTVLIDNNYIARIFEKKNYSKISIYKYGYKLDLTSVMRVNNFYISNLNKCPSSCLKNFKTVLFKNTEVNIPSDYNTYLSYIYGNWKLPAKRNYYTIKGTRIEHYRYIISNILYEIKKILRLIKK